MVLQPIGACPQVPGNSDAAWRGRVRAALQVALPQLGSDEVWPSLAHTSIKFTQFTLDCSLTPQVLYLV